MWDLITVYSFVYIAKETLLLVKKRTDVVYLYSRICISIRRNEDLIHAITGMDLDNIKYMKKASHKRPHVTWFHSYEVSRVCKSLKTENQLVVA